MEIWEHLWKTYSSFSVFSAISPFLTLTAYVCLVKIFSSETSIQFSWRWCQNMMKVFINRRQGNYINLHNLPTILFLSACTSIIFFLSCTSTWHPMEESFVAIGYWLSNGLLIIICKILLQFDNTFVINSSVFVD